MNIVILNGRLGKDPEVKRLDGGNIVANLTLATQRNKETTDWHNVVVWGKPAEVVEKYVKKGDQLGVEGSLQTRMWEKDGQTRYTTEVICFKVYLSGTKRDGDTTPQIEDSDDLPF